MYLSDLVSGIVGCCWQAHGLWLQADRSAFSHTENLITEACTSTTVEDCHLGFNASGCSLTWTSQITSSGMSQ